MRIFPTAPQTYGVSEGEGHVERNQPVLKNKSEMDIASNSRDTAVPITPHPEQGMKEQADLGTVLAAEAAGQRKAGESHDAGEGAMAFLQKRPAQFTGQ